VSAGSRSAWRRCSLSFWPGLTGQVELAPDRWRANQLPVVDPCPFCSIPAERIWIESEHAIAFGADAPAAEGHIVVVPKEHVPSIHALPIAAQKGVWALVSERSLLRHDFRSRC
jgi:hypothetical protein